MVEILDNIIGLDIPAEGVDIAIKDGGLNNTNAEETLLSLSSIPISGAAPITNA